MCKDIVRQFWKYIDLATFDRLNEIMHKEAVVILANTDEKMTTCQDYIDFNKEYPGRWHADVKHIVGNGEEWVSAVKITSEDTLSLYVTSFFTIKEERIIKIIEFYGENNDAPLERKGKYHIQHYSL